MADFTDLHRQPVLVLGASGFIGSRVVAALADNATLRPVPVARRFTGSGSIVADATNADAMRSALSEGAFVVNCIAGNDRAMIRTTEVLCEAARLTPPRRIVHLSSMAVYGAATGTVREDQAPVAPVSGYGQAKLTCERLMRRYVDGGGDAVALRPTCVFGPSSPQWTTRIGRLLQARRIGDLGAAGDGNCNMIFIDDLVTTIIATLDAPRVSGQAFNVSNPARLTWNEFLMRFGIALGATPVRRITPRMLKIETKLLAPVRRVAAKGTHHPATEAITPSLAALWAQDIRIDSSAASRVLGMPITSIEQMIAAAVASLPSKEPVRS